ncbi:MAG: hypothetical protein PHI98_09085 [Eubacteriales bacterium]|nr:hypothetical protein [Eubacteriales bacterium]
MRAGQSLPDDVGIIRQLRPKWCFGANAFTFQKVVADMTLADKVVLITWTDITVDSGVSCCLLKYEKNWESID